MKKTISERVIGDYDKVFNALKELGSNPNGPELKSATHSPAKRFLENIGRDAKSTSVYFGNLLALNKADMETEMEGVGDARVKIDECLNSKMEDFTTSQRYQSSVYKLNHLVFIWAKGKLKSEFDCEFNPDVTKSALNANKQSNQTQAFADYSAI